jgi:hypothetical protein
MTTRAWEHENLTDWQDDTFGLCPDCKHNDGVSNIGTSQWFFCREHRKRWCIDVPCALSGFGLVIPCVQQAETDFDTYEIIQPWRWPDAMRELVEAYWKLKDEQSR